MAVKSVINGIMSHKPKQLSRIVFELTGKDGATNLR